MPYAKNADINIYYEVEGEGPPLLMHHGLGSGLHRMREYGYVDALKDDYQVIVMDARGHGKSDKPHDPAMYLDEMIVGDIIAVLNSLGIEKTNYYGYSYGGGNAWKLAKYTPERMNSLIVGGNGGRLPPREMQENRIKLFAAEKEALVAARERTGPKSSGVEADQPAIDYDALIACCTGIGLGLPNEGAMSSMSMPFLLLVGESDWNFPWAKKASERLPDSTLISLPGLDHGQAFARLDLVIPHIKEFLARVN